MHKSLLVCVDNSTESTLAIDLSAKLASLSGTGLTGLHVYAAKLPKGGKPKEDVMPVWTLEAEERLRKTPFFLRRMIRSGVEKYAAFKNIKEIPPELMAELRSKTPFLQDKGGR